MIELENVTMTYPGGMTALKNVNINIEKGEFVFIVGSSGSGKTTLIKLLSLIKGTRSDIRFYPCSGI